MNLLRIKTMFMLCICLFMMLTGMYMTFENMLHVFGGDAESHAELSILHLGHVSGSEHLIILAFGILLIFLSAKFLWKINIKEHLQVNPKLTHSITKLGKEIARRMRRKDE